MMRIDYSTAGTVADAYEFVFSRFAHDHCRYAGKTRLWDFEDLFNYYCFEIEIRPVAMSVLKELIMRSELALHCKLEGPNAVVYCSVSYEPDEELVREYKREWYGEEEESEEAREQRLREEARQEYGSSYMYWISAAGYRPLDMDEGFDC